MVQMGVATKNTRKSLFTSVVLSVSANHLIQLGFKILNSVILDLEKEDVKICSILFFGDSFANKQSVVYILFPKEMHVVYSIVQ